MLALNGQRHFSANELRDAYRRIGVEAGRTIYVTGDFGRLGFPSGLSCDRISGKQAILDLHLCVLEELVGPGGNIAFPAHSWGLVGSHESFDPDTTPCDYAFSEHLRTNRPCQRQFHPFSSVAATGPDSHALISPGVSRHPNGPGTPFARMTDAEALHVSVGLPARRSISAVHHCEFAAGVPYRYTKSFTHHCRTETGIQEIEFFIFVIYRAEGMVRDRNRKLFSLTSIADNLRNVRIGRSAIESVPLNIFVPTAIQAMQKDPYIYMEALPDMRPWTI